MQTPTIPGKPKIPAGQRKRVDNLLAVFDRPKHIRDGRMVDPLADPRPEVPPVPAPVAQPERRALSATARQAIAPRAPLDPALTSTALTPDLHGTDGSAGYQDAPDGMRKAISPTTGKMIFAREGMAQELNTQTSAQNSAALELEVSNAGGAPTTTLPGDAPARRNDVVTRPARQSPVNHAARDTANARRRTGTSVNVPLDVRVAAMTGNDPKRLAQWGGSTQGRSYGGEGALIDDLKLSPMQKAIRQQTLDNQRLRADSTRLGMEQSIASAGRAEDAHDLNMERGTLGLEQSIASANRAEETHEMNKTRFDLNLAAADEQAAQATAAFEQEIADRSTLGNTRADVLEAQNPGYATVLARDPALEAAIDFNRAGKLDDAADFLDMRAEAAPKLEVQSLEGYGNVLTQDGVYKGTAPKQADTAARQTILQQKLNAYDAERVAAGQAPLTAAERAQYMQQDLEGKGQTYSLTDYLLNGYTMPEAQQKMREQMAGRTSPARPAPAPVTAPAARKPLDRKALADEFKF